MNTPGIEIERRFKLVVASNRLSKDNMLVSQWYLPNTGAWTTRCRITTSHKDGGGSTYDQTMKREIFELNNSMTQAEFILMKQHCFEKGVTKWRYHKHLDGYLWELDAFKNLELCGLEIAEIELPCLSTDISIPIWIGVEITKVRCFSNVSLSYFLNCPEDHDLVMAKVLSCFGQRYNGNFNVVGRQRLADVFKFPVKVTNGITELLISEHADGILNDQELRWLKTDENITFIDLVLLITFVRRKIHGKKPLKTQR